MKPFDKFKKNITPPLAVYAGPEYFMNKNSAAGTFVCPGCGKPLPGGENPECVDIDGRKYCAECAARIASQPAPYPDSHSVSSEPVMPVYAGPSLEPCLPGSVIRRDASENTNPGEKHCPVCGAGFDAVPDVCPGCGINLTVCGGCGYIYSGGKFCPECGSPANAK